MRNRIVFNRVAVRLRLGWWFFMIGVPGAVSVATVARIRTRAPIPVTTEARRTVHPRMEAVGLEALAIPAPAGPATGEQTDD